MNLGSANGRLEVDVVRLLLCLLSELLCVTLRGKKSKSRMKMIMETAEELQKYIALTGSVGLVTWFSINMKNCIVKIN